MGKIQSVQGPYISRLPFIDMETEKKGQGADVNSTTAVPLSPENVKHLPSFANPVTAKMLLSLEDVQTKDDDAPEQESAQEATPAGPSETESSSLSSGRVRNLKAIIQNDARWRAFVKGVSRQNPDSEPIKDFRRSLTHDIDGYNRYDLDKSAQISKLGAVFAKEEGGVSDAGEINSRVRMWLDNPEFFEKLFSAIGDQKLSGRPELFTDSRLVDFISTFDVGTF